MRVRSAIMAAEEVWVKKSDQDDNDAVDISLAA